MNPHEVKQKEIANANPTCVHINILVYGQNLINPGSIKLKYQNSASSQCKNTAQSVWMIIKHALVASHWKSIASNLLSHLPTHPNNQLHCFPIVKPQQKLQNYLAMIEAEADYIRNWREIISDEELVDESIVITKGQRVQIGSNKKLISTGETLKKPLCQKQSLSRCQFSHSFSQSFSQSWSERMTTGSVHPDMCNAPWCTFSASCASSWTSIFGTPWMHAGAAEVNESVLVLGLDFDSHHMQRLIC